MDEKTKFNYSKLFPNQRKNITQILRQFDIEYKVIYSGKKPIGTDINELHLMKVIELTKNSNHYGTQQRIKYLKGLLWG